MKSEYKEVLKELDAPLFITEISDAEYLVLKEWITNLLIKYQRMEEDEIEAIFNTDEDDDYDRGY